MKAYTDISQSKKLAEILPKESADMSYRQVFDEDRQWNSHVLDLMPFRFASFVGIPAQSLSALLGCLKDRISTPNGIVYDLIIMKDEGKYRLFYFADEWKLPQLETKFHTDPIDACVEMIKQLKEKDLI